MQGLNARCSIYRASTASGDDAIGGAVPVRSVQYKDLRCRVSAVVPSVFAREQGMETGRDYTAVIYPARKYSKEELDIRENDEFFITHPSAHEMYEEYMLIRGVQLDSLNPNNRRRHIELSLERTERSRDLSP